jgi:hypothetical protein
MDLVIPYLSRDGNHQALKYLLRSAELFLPNHGQVFIYGTEPIGFRNIKHVPATDSDNPKYRERNMFDKLLKASLNPEVSEDFIYSGDDFYLLKKFTELPYYYSVDFGGNALYLHTIRNTMKHFKLKQLPNFDVHFPIVFNKKAFVEKVDSLAWLYPYGYLIKTSYCMMNNIYPERAVYREDFKFPRLNELSTKEMLEAIQGREFFSIDKRTLTEPLLEMLEFLYPTPSRYES